MTAEFEDQRPRFEQLANQVSATALEPYGFTRAKSRIWSRTVGDDLQHDVTWEKTRPTTASIVRFYVEFSATWLTGPALDAAGDLPPRVMWSRLNIEAADRLAADVAEPYSPSDKVFEVWKLAADSDVTVLSAVLAQALGEQARRRLDDVFDVSDCVRELSIPDASIPGSQTLLMYYAETGDRARAQGQYSRLRRHFGHRDFPRDPRLRSVVAELQLVDPPD